MKIKVLTIVFFLLANFSYSQIKKKDLIGTWKTDNDLFSKSDTIKFHQHLISCYQMLWIFEKKDFKKKELNICSEPHQVKAIIAEEKIKLKRTDFGQIIEYYQNRVLTDKFRIINFNKKDEPELKLMRFDKLSEQKLYRYVDSLIFKVLEFKPDLKVSEHLNEAFKIDDNSNFNVKIKVRDGGTGNPEPLIVVNGYPLKNRELLKELLLVETYNIKHLNKEQSLTIYGSRAINGVIILQTSEKRFKNILKKYGR